MATLNWEKIEQNYITGEYSYADLARIYGVSKKQIARYGKARQWVEKRQAFRTKTATKGLRKAKEEAAEGAALIFKIARLLLEKFYAALQADGIDLSPHHAAQWAQILLALEQAGRTGEAQKIIVKWVTGSEE